MKLRKAILKTLKIVFAATCCACNSACQERANTNTIQIGISEVSPSASSFTYEWGHGMENSQVRSFLAPGSAAGSWIQLNFGGEEIGEVILVYGMKDSSGSVVIGINWAVVENVRLILRAPNGQEIQKLLIANGSDAVTLQAE